MAAIALQDTQTSNTKYRLTVPGVDVKDDHALIRLCQAVLLTALRDAAGVNMSYIPKPFEKEGIRQEAREWLRWSEDCKAICVLTGLDHDLIIRWLGSGCPWKSDKRSKQQKGGSDGDQSQGIG